MRVMLTDVMTSVITGVDEKAPANVLTMKVKIIYLKD